MDGPRGRVPTSPHDFDYGYRSQRIRDLLTSAAKAGRKLQVSDMQSIQADTYSGIAAKLVPVLLKLNVNDPFTQQAVDLLKDMGLHGAETDSAAAAYFNAVWGRPVDLTFDGRTDRRGCSPTAAGGGQRPWPPCSRTRRDTVVGRPAGTPGVIEGRDEILRRGPGLRPGCA